jgi:NDP-sugar pyrophosphorylase family protein
MNGMVLAAGFGTRLLPHTRRLPKPLFPVIDNTLLDRAIGTLVAAGATRIVVNGHHLADLIESHLATRDYGVETIFSREAEILGTAGGIKRAEKWLGDDETLVVNADILFTPDATPLIERHRRTGALATLALRPHPDPGKYGALRMNDDGRITGYPSAASPDDDPTAPSLMFTGLSLISPPLFDLIPDGSVDISAAIYGPMVIRGGPLYGVSFDDRWRDLGTVDDYRAVTMELLDETALTPATAWADAKGIVAHPPVYVAPGATVEPGAELGPRVAIYAGAVVGAGARVKGSVLLPGGRVGPGEDVTGAVVGPTE